MNSRIPLTNLLKLAASVILIFSFAPIAESQPLFRAAGGKLKAGGQSTGIRSKKLDLSGAKEFKCGSNAPFAHPYFWSPFVLIGNRS